MVFISLNNPQILTGAKQAKEKKKKKKEQKRNEAKNVARCGQQRSLLKEIKGWLAFVCIRRLFQIKSQEGASFSFNWARYRDPHLLKCESD